MIEVRNIGTTDDYVYDISLDGTVVNALGETILSNTDGFNFKMPDKFRYTEENPYIGQGLNRDVEKGKKYVGLQADVMEFDDKFMRVKMGLGIDEIALATINLSRKNYMDYLEGAQIKKVGNTIKSKKMPGYIEKFIEKAGDLLLFGKGKEFLDLYYEYIEKIYNYKIPLKDIASKGKVKKTLTQYKADCETVTKSGNKKARQAWYELLLRHKDVHVDIGDTVYYINTGTKKGDSDVKRTTVYYQIKPDVGEVDITKDIEKAFNSYKNKCKKLIANMDGADKDEIESHLIYDKSAGKYVNRYTKIEVFGKKGEDGDSKPFSKSPFAKELFGEEKILSKDEIVMNCVLLDRDIVESEEDRFCDEGIEYNVVKYIEQFNSRIKPLLVCFSRKIRDSILVKNPADRKYFTEEESMLTSGEPYKVTDQDTYEELMTMDRREVDFWMGLGEEPPFVHECGMDWEGIQKKHLELLEREKNERFKELDREYLKILDDLSEDEIKDFLDDGIIPASLQKIVYIKEDSADLRFYFKDLEGMSPSTGGYIFDDITMDIVYRRNEAEFERFIFGD